MASTSLVNPVFYRLDHGGQSTMTHDQNEVATADFFYFIWILMDWWPGTGVTDPVHKSPVVLQDFFAPTSGKPHLIPPIWSSGSLTITTGMLSNSNVHEKEKHRDNMQNTQTELGIKLETL